VANVIYPVCGDLGAAASTGIPNVNVAFNGPAIVNVNTSVGGIYSATLLYRTNYISSLSLTNYFDLLADFASVDSLPPSCRGVSDSRSFTITTESLTILDGQRATANNVNFGMAMARNPWIQIADGDVVGYTSITSTIPDTCNSGWLDCGSGINYASCLCVPYLSIISQNNSSADNNGLSTTNDSSVAIGNGVGYGYQSNLLAISSLLTQRTDGRWGYAYLRNLFYDGSNETVIVMADLEDLAGTSLNSGISVLFVSGSLNINSNFAVADGASLVVIVSGDILITNNVTALDGIYIADGSITSTGTAGTTANLNGTFVADANQDSTGSYRNTRSLSGIENNLNPAVRFSYRPDMIVSLLKSSFGTKFDSPTLWDEAKP
jgi:hypothetical protein